MKLGYGTYGMPEVSIWEALPRLAAIGYQAVELCAVERYPTAPHRLSPADRRRLRELLGELGLELSALMVFPAILAPEPELEPEERQFRETCRLGRDLDTVGRPVVVSTLSACDLGWDEATPLVVERVARFGEIAAGEGCRFALEPHVGGLLDRPDRAVFLMERLHSPSLGLNFDISHFAAEGYPAAETIRALARYAFHTHVKDARQEGGRVRFLLPGAGDFDYSEYFREMRAAGYRGVVTAEVSVQVSRQPDYDPWSAAEFCYRTLRNAREQSHAT